jgi:hypothetical protein
MVRMNKGTVSQKIVTGLNDCAARLPKGVHNSGMLSCDAG